MELKAHPQLQAILSRERKIKISAFLLILISGFFILLTIDNLLLSFILAFVTSYLLSPIVNWLERKGLPRQVAILIPFAAAGILIGITVYSILPIISEQLASFESQLPGYQVDIMNLVANTEKRFQGVFRISNIKFSDSVNTWVINQTAMLSSSLPSAISGSLTVLLLTPIFAFFMLQDGKSFSRNLLSFVPNNIFEIALNLLHQINEQMGGFIRARFLEAAIVGFVVWIGLLLCGFPYSGLLGLFAGLTNLIPYLGPIIGAVPALVIAMVSADAAITESMSLNLILITSIYLFAQLIDIIFIIPLVVAKIVNLHPVTVIIVIIIGSQVMGILGMVISIPVASAVKLIFQAFYQHLVAYRS